MYHIIYETNTHTFRYEIQRPHKVCVNIEFQSDPSYIYRVASFLSSDTWDIEYFNITKRRVDK